MAFRSTLLGVAMASSALLGIALAAPAAAQGLDDAEYVKGFKPRLARVQSRVQEARALKVDKAAFSTAAVIDALGRKADAQSVFFFVRDQIAFEPYEGAQRGVTGTLMARAGNSVDQALLLQALLAEIKVRSRVVSGSLSREDGVRLLADFVGKGELVGPHPEVMAAYQVASDRSLMGDIKKHYWLEAYAEGRWVAMDPSFARSVHGVAIGTKKAEHEGVPPEADQQLVVRVFAIEDNGGGGEVISLRRPMAEAIHRNITLKFEAVDRQGDTRNPWIQIGGDVERGRKFRWKGLQRLWVEFSFERGGVVREKIARDLFAQGSATNLLSAQQQVFSMIVLPSWLHDPFLTAVVQQEIAALHDLSAEMAATIEKEALKAVREREVDPQFATYVDKVLGTSGGLIALTFANVADQIALQMAARHGVRAFYGEPRIIIVAGLRHEDRIYWQIDLRHNVMRAAPAEGLPPLAADAFLAARGRFDSQFEAAVVKSLTGKPVLNVGGIFEAALKDGLPMVTLTSINIEKILDTLPLSEEARERLSQAVRQRGRNALVPGKPVKIGGADTSGWWEMDVHGAIVGVKENGAHGAGNFSAATVTGNEDDKIREGSMRVLVFDEVLSLIENLADTTVSLIKSTPDVCPIVCASTLDLTTISGLLCKTGPAKAPANLSAELQICLTPQKQSEDILGLSQTCEDRVKPTRCGGILAHALLSGSHSVKITTAPVGSPSGPWAADDLPGVAFDVCGCK